MASLREWLLRLWGSVRRGPADRDMEEELRSHLELASDDLKRSGLAADDAARNATNRYGRVAPALDAMRDQRGLPLLQDLTLDTNYAIRSLRRNPAFTVVVVLTLALGIGAQTVVFSLLNTLMFRRLPVRNPDELVEFLSQYPNEPRMDAFAWKYYEHFRDRSDVFSALTGFSPTRWNVKSREGELQETTGAYVIGDFFPTLGLKPELGRLITPEDDRLESPASVAVISRAYWNRSFGLDPSVIGKQIAVNGTVATIIGVADSGFYGLDPSLKVDLWLPVAMEPLLSQPSHRIQGDLPVAIVGRVKPGVAIQRVQAEMNVLDQWRVDDMASNNTDPLWRQLKLFVELASTGLPTLRDRFARPALVLMAAVTMLLLLTCANVAGMMLARNAGLQREIALRVSLGASRLRLIRQTLTEALLLAAVGGIASVFAALWGTEGLVRILTSGRDRIAVEVPLDWHVLAFALGIAILTGILFGLGPALLSSRSAPMNSLKASATGTETWPGRLYGDGMVILQISMAVAILSCALLFVSRLQDLRSPQNLGFHRESVLMVSIDLPRAAHPRSQLTELYDSVTDRLRKVRGLTSVALSSAPLLSGGGESHFVEVEGRAENGPDRRYTLVNRVGPKFFETLGTPLLAGRDFSSNDAVNEPVTIINQTMANHYFPDGQAIGKHLNFTGDKTSYEIIGISSNAKYYEPGEQSWRSMYLNRYHATTFSPGFVLASSASVPSLEGKIQKAIREIAPDAKVSPITALSDQVDASIVTERALALLSEGFGMVSLALVAIAFYGLLAFRVSRRIKEVGIRLALGATPVEIRRMILKSAIKLLGTGILVGVPMAFWSQSVARALIENLGAGTPILYLVSALGLLAVALMAALLPANRASRVDPVESLRQE